LALSLLWFGGAAVAISLIVGLQVLAVPRMGADFGREALVVPAWGLLSLLLAFLLRRKADSPPLKFLGTLWLLIGVATLVWFARA